MKDWCREQVIQADSAENAARQLAQIALEESGKVNRVQGGGLRVEG